MNRKEDILYYDFQGWPVYKKTLREILEELGATVKNGRIGFKEDNKILDTYPKTIQDDGMGYGIEETFISNINISEDRDRNPMILIWRDIKDEKSIEEHRRE